jgi:hypothetical protein
MGGALLLGGCSSRNDGRSIILIMSGRLVADMIRQAGGLCVVGWVSCDRSLLVLGGISESVVVMRGIVLVRQN